MHKAQLRKENWIRVQGGSATGVMVWLEKERKKGGGFTLSVGVKGRNYDFCSVGCLIDALEGKESI